MMRATLKVSDNLSIQVEGENQKEMFDLVGKQQEIFADRKCGCCGGKGGFKTRFVKRHVGTGKKTFDYYEIHCLDQSCKARFSFGVLQDGEGLFPKLKDEEGNWLPNNGWIKYVPQNKE